MRPSCPQVRNLVPARNEAVSTGSRRAVIKLPSRRCATPFASSRSSTTPYDSDAETCRLPLRAGSSVARCRHSTGLERTTKTTTPRSGSRPRRSATLPLVRRELSLPLSLSVARHRTHGLSPLLPLSRTRASFPRRHHDDAPHRHAADAVRAGPRHGPARCGRRRAADGAAESHAQPQRRSETVLSLSRRVFPLSDRALSRLPPQRQAAPGLVATRSVTEYSRELMVDGTPRRVPSSAAERCVHPPTGRFVH